MIKFAVHLYLLYVPSKYPNSAYTMALQWFLGPLNVFVYVSCHKEQHNHSFYTSTPIMASGKKLAHKKKSCSLPQVAFLAYPPLKMEACYSKAYL